MMFLERDRCGRCEPLFGFGVKWEIFLAELLMVQTFPERRLSSKHWTDSKNGPHEGVEVRSDELGC